MPIESVGFSNNYGLLCPQEWGAFPNIEYKLSLTPRKHAPLPLKLPNKFKISTLQPPLSALPSHY